jgi:Spy/CpxP family protein refolding chaperone
MIPAALMAQPPDDFPRGNMPGHGNGMGGKRAAMENLRFLKLLEALDLNEEQSQQFVPLFHGYRKATRELHKERWEIFGRLEELIKQENVDDDILRTLDELRENDKKMEQRHEQFFTDCSAFFTVPQLARMAIFHERFERDILKRLRDFHRGDRMPDDIEINQRQGR